MSIAKMTKVLLVGSGMTGAATAANLRQQLPKQTTIHVWDKARGAGGRMSTSRSPKDPNSTVDLGAQYISLLPEYADKRKALYTELQTEGVLGPLCGSIEGQNQFDQPGTSHFVAPNGVSSLVKHFLKKADADVKFQHQVSDISFTNGSQGQAKVTTADGSVSDTFDVVVITIPVPQILQLQGSLKELLESKSDVKERLERVSYSSRFAMGLFFVPDTTLTFPWSAKYFMDSDCVRFISVDNAKRGKTSPSVGPSMAVHTNVPYGLRRIDDPLEEVKEDILTHVHKLLPDLPPIADMKPQKWRYSQVHKAYEGTPGCVVLNTKPLIVLAGDAFTKSTFDGCLDSAESVTKAVLQAMKSSNI